MGTWQKREDLCPAKNLCNSKPTAVTELEVSKMPNNVFSCQHHKKGQKMPIYVVHAKHHFFMPNYYEKGQISGIWT